MSEEQDDFEDVRPAHRKRKSAASDSLPVLVIVMMIIDIMLCLGKVLTGAGNFFVVFAAQQAPQLAPLVPLSVACGILDFLIFLVGLSAAIGILVQKSWGKVLGIITAVLTLISILASSVLGYQSGQIQIQNAINQGADPGVMKAAALGGMIGGAAIRLLLLGLYAVALAQFGKWLASRSAKVED